MIVPLEFITVRFPAIDPVAIGMEPIFIVLATGPLSELLLCDGDVRHVEIVSDDHVVDRIFISGAPAAAHAEALRTRLRDEPEAGARDKCIQGRVGLGFSWRRGTHGDSRR
jgi:hypothetical protein